MARIIPLLVQAILTASVLGVPLAQANPIFLESAAFADGGTAVGWFAFTSYGYLSGETISTTAGSSLSGYVYTSGQLDPNVPPASQLDFGSASDFTLVLEVVSPLGADSSNYDALIPGRLDGSVLSGSYEFCTQSSCGGAAAYRLIESGTTYAPEPSALSLLAFGLVASGFARPRLNGRRGSAV